MPLSRDRLLYEDEYFLAVQKLSGELVVKGKGAIGKLPLLNFLRKEYPGLRALHRLDFETSGVVVFARTKEAYIRVVGTRFSSWRKVYRTLVIGRMNRRTGRVRKSLPARGGRGVVAEAVTEYVVLERFAQSSYVEVEIQTGRRHQIRRHFASIGHPLVLDSLYGSRKFNRVFQREFGFRRFFLHAVRVEFVHPITGGKINIEAPLPRTFRQLLEVLRSL